MASFPPCPAGRNRKPVYRFLRAHTHASRSSAVIAGLRPSPPATRLPQEAYSQAQPRYPPRLPNREMRRTWLRPHLRFRRADVSASHPLPTPPITCLHRQLCSPPLNPRAVSSRGVIMAAKGSLVAWRVVFAALGVLMVGTLVYTCATDGSPFRRELLTP